MKVVYHNMYNGGMLQLSHKIYIALLTGFISFSAVSGVHAQINEPFLTPTQPLQESESSQYRLQNSNISVQSNETNKQKSTLATTFGEEVADTLAKDGIAVTKGFLYLNDSQTTPFNLTLSDIVLDFGTLLPNTFYKESFDIQTTFVPKGHYAITLETLQPFTLVNSETTIAATQCNGADQTCTSENAATWNDVDQYGYGYTLQGSGKPEDFNNENHVRAFPSTSKPLTILHTLHRKQTEKSTFYTVVNIPSFQPRGTYQSIIQLTATATY